MRAEGVHGPSLRGVRWPDVRLDVARPVIKVERVVREEWKDKNGFVIPVADERRARCEKNNQLLRDRLPLVGVDVPDLIHGTDAVRAFDDRSWSTTFATWCDEAGYRASWIDRWLGHAPKSTADKHDKKNTPHFEDVLLKQPAPGAVGPFPALPASLLGTPKGIARVSPYHQGMPQKDRQISAKEGT